jgi:hypothetical protein
MIEDSLSGSRENREENMFEARTQAEKEENKEELIDTRSKKINSCFVDLVTGGTTWDQFLLSEA